MTWVSREEQLTNPANFVKDGQLYLVRCLNCAPPPRGRENWLPAAASGCCAWCGWGYFDPETGELIRR